MKGFSLRLVKIEHLDESIDVCDHKKTSSNVKHLEHGNILVHMTNWRQSCQICVKNCWHAKLEDVLSFSCEDRLRLFGQASHEFFDLIC